MHGVRGQVKVFPTTDDAGRYRKLKKVFLDTGNGMKELDIEGVKFFKQFVIVKFKDYDSINDIERYKGCPLFVSRDNAVKLNKDEYFIADLIDMRVIDENDAELGRIDDVLRTGANDVYIIKSSDGRELLLPAIKDCILNVDIKARLMKVHVLKGLLD